MLSKSLCIAIVVLLGDYLALRARLAVPVMRHIITILLQNEAGALGRVAGMFSTRGYNIESLNVAPTQDDTVSRLTLVTTGSDQVIDQINKQLGKLVDVVNIADMTSGDHIERELVLLKLSVPEDEQSETSRLVADQGGRVLDDRGDHLTVEFVGGAADVDRFIAALQPIAEVLAVVRSGVMAIARGEPILTQA